MIRLKGSGSVVSTLMRPRPRARMAYVCITGTMTPFAVNPKTGDSSGSTGLVLIRKISTVAAAGSTAVWR